MQESMERDIQCVCDGIHRIAKLLKLNMELTPSALYTMIIHYLEVRCTVVHPFEIRGPTRRVSKPRGWTDTHETIWVQWLDHEVPIDRWTTLVIDPVFDHTERLWEIEMGGWRDEIYTFMPFWFVRSIPRFEEIDPTALPDEEDDGWNRIEEKKKTGMDPYLADYYDRR